MSPAALLAFASASLGAAGLLMLVPALRGPGGHPGARAVWLLVRAGTRLRPLRLAAPADLGSRLAAAGGAGGLGPRELMAAKAGAGLLAGAVGGVVAAGLPGRLGLAVSLGAPVAGFFGPDLWLARRAAERARRVRRELPGMLDLLRVTVEAGRSLPAALESVGRRGEGPLAEEWLAVGREAALGVPLGDSLDAMSLRLPQPEVRALLATLERARCHGTPLAEALAAQARDTRFALRRRVQEDAARAGPKIQLVVALLLVPSVLLLVAAALASALLEPGKSLVVV